MKGILLAAGLLLSVLLAMPAERASAAGISWEFNTDGNLEGWTMANQVSGSVSGGRLNLITTGSGPYIVSPDNLGLSAANNRYIHIRMRNSTSSVIGRLFFTTTSSTNFDGDKYISFQLQSISGFKEYTIDMKGLTGWTGTIKQLRFDPVMEAGAVNIDYIQVDNTNTLLDERMTPFWASNAMYNESLLMTSTGGGLPTAPLLFTPTSIQSVRDSALGTVYTEGTDWIYDSATNSIKLPTGSRAVSLTTADLYPSSYGPNTMNKVGGGYVLFAEGSYIHSKQLAITYTHNANVWNGPVPVYDASKLPVTLGKLNNGNPVKIVLYGDSIAVGANASDFVGAEPYMPSWGDLIVEKLRDVYASKITFANPSSGGQDSGWGAYNASSLVASQNPDLVIIAFGMNDGTAGVSPSTYKNNIQSIMNTVKAANANAEFIVVSPTLANPETYFAGQQANYKSQLQSLTGTGVVMADMTGVHQELLNHKNFRDMTGNNVNHPNDFLTRWYAQIIAGSLVNTSGGTAPAAPTGLTANGGNAQVALSWTASSGATSYTVKRGTTSGTYGTTVASGVTGTSYTDTTVTNGTTYYYVVTATNSAGTSGNSTEASAAPSSGSGSYAKEWNFNTDGDQEGWGVAYDMGTSVSGGYLNITSWGTNPFIHSPDGLGVSASANGHVYVKMSNSSSNTSGKIYFTTTSSTNFDESKAVAFTVQASSGQTVYDVNMSVNANWTGTIKQIRFDPIEATGNLAVDYIKIGNNSGTSAPSAPTGLTATGGNAQVALSWTASSGATSYTVKRGTTSGTYGTTVASGVTGTSYTDTTVTNGTTYYYVVTATNSGGTSGNSSAASATPAAGGGSIAVEWNFNTDGNLENWWLANDIGGTVSGGSLNLTSYGTDPYMYAPDNLSIAASNTHVVIRMKNDTSNTDGKIFFTTNSSTNFDEAKSVSFTTTANSGYIVYNVDMSGNANWTGTIKRIRIDPLTTTGTVQIDYIKIVAP